MNRTRSAVRGDNNISRTCTLILMHLAAVCLSKSCFKLSPIRNILDLPGIVLVPPPSDVVEDQGLARQNRKDQPTRVNVLVIDQMISVRVTLGKQQCPDDIHEKGISAGIASIVKHMFEGINAVGLRPLVELRRQINPHVVAIPPIEKPIDMLFGTSMTPSHTVSPDTCAANDSGIATFCNHSNRVCFPILPISFERIQQGTAFGVKLVIISHRSPTSEIKTEIVFVSLKE